MKGAIPFSYATVVELAVTTGLGPVALYGRVGSSPTSRTLFYGENMFETSGIRNGLYFERADNRPIALKVGPIFAPSDKTLAELIKELPVKALPENKENKFTLEQVQTIVLNGERNRIASESRRGIANVLMFNPASILPEDHAMFKQRLLDTVVVNDDVPENEMWVIYWHLLGDSDLPEDSRVVDGAFQIVNGVVHLAEQNPIGNYVSRIKLA